MAELRPTINTAEDVARLEERVLAAAARTLDVLPALLATPSPIDAFAPPAIRANWTHPIEDRALNLVEQLNQTFTCLASLRAAAWILSRHPDSAPLRLNLGTASGSDIEALDGSLAAETFAAVIPSNNDKLRKDVAKVALTSARLKYVFYICPRLELAEPITASGNPNVHVVSLGWVSIAPVDVPDRRERASLA